MAPGWPWRERTISSARPLKAWREVGLEGLERGRVAVVDAGDGCGPADMELHEVVGERAEVPVPVLDADRDEGEIRAIGRNRLAIGRQHDARGRAGGLHGIDGELLAVAVADRLQLTGRIGDIPLQPELADEGARLADIAAHWHREGVDAQFLAAERVAIEPQLDLLGVGVDRHRDLLTLVAGPVPVREEVQRGLIGPHTAVEVEAVLGEAGQVDDAEIRTMRGPIAGVAVRRRLAEIVEAGPDEFTQDVRELVLGLELHVRAIGPGRSLDVVAAYLMVGGLAFQLHRQMIDP